MLNKPKRNPTWSREELILALDLYFELGSGSRFSSANSQIIELSEMLNKLQVHSERPDEIKFRNPNGVSMKLSNFLRFDPNYKGVGLTRGGQLEKVIWDEFSDDSQKLRKTAQKIKESIT